MTEIAALLLGFAAGMAVMVLIYGERNHRDVTRELRRLRAWANGQAEPQRPANDCSDAPQRARSAGL